MLLLELAQALHAGRDADRVGATEHAAFEWREAEAEDRHDVDVARIRRDAVFHATNRFVEELQPATIRDLRARHRLVLPTHELVHGSVDALLLAVFVAIEAAAVLSAFATVFADLLGRGGRLEAIAELRLQRLADLLADVDADL